jgi:hypothetical protein
MSIFYVPYYGDSPAALDINGHRLVILSKSKRVLKNSLGLLGADQLQKVSGGATQAEQLEIFTQIGKRAKSGIVVIPSDVPLADIIQNLEHQLPWLH